MRRNLNLWALSLVLVLFFGGLSSVSAKPPPAKIVSGLVSNVASMLWKWLWSLHSSATTTTTTKSAVSSRSMVKFESGYNIETVFDGSKFGIEPYGVEVSTNGELLVLDSENSNLHRISMPLSTYGRPKLVSGSTEGFTGHVDGKLKEARMNRPRGLTTDDRGNIYVADTNNMAIRKISDDVSTIAGGRRGRGGSGHIDGPAEDAKFSDDFDLVYVSGSCSLLVIDRGNQAIREIQLHQDDCSQEPDRDIHLGTALLISAAFFGYMLALLQRRVRMMFSSSRNDKRYMVKPGMQMAPYHQRYSTPVRPPLIPPEHEPDKPDEGFFGSLGKLVVKTGSSVSEVLSGSQRMPQNYQYQHQQDPNMWQAQDSFVMPEGSEPRVGVPDKTYLRAQATSQNRSYYQQKQDMNEMTSYENNREKNEIVFGAVQEQDGRREAMVIKAVDFSETMNDQRNLRPRINYMGYSSHAF
ncbi:PREDICTED: uncharacterized protein LOC104802407 isoform X2 [Tarenaya hassleriana]|uniref:uncharacterized protein LOC104802407 isoform X2 n=1 Tax=Tarenaya hassleriana TaxID=28532 RepID=UPI00053C742F|nr:PREDICTED: uncharacterized protein LOC104802407 isoform X2 [Tarenaya hassleriana]